MQLHELNDMTTTDKTEQITNNNNNNKQYINNDINNDIINDKNINYINNNIKDNNEDNKNSPSTSINSHNVSIVSLDENDDDSSVVTDSDDNSDFEDTSINIPDNLAIDYINNFNHFDNNNAINHEKGLIIINQKLDNYSVSNDVGATTSSKPSFGSVAVQNSSDVTFGNKTFYQGPVTIKQFLLDNNKWRPSESSVDNPAFPQNSITNNTNVNNSVTNNINDETINANKGFKNFFIENKRIGIFATFTILFGVILITTVAFMITNLSRSSIHENKLGDGDKSEKNSPLDTNLERDLITQGTALRMISRDEWIAQPAANELEQLVLPVDNVIFAHTVTDNCSTQAICILRVRLIQTFHMESKSWDDIGYNFLVGGDGAIYEGRGWDKQGAHTKGYNFASIGIALIGTFNTIVPPERQLKAAKRLLEEGVNLKKLTPDYKLYGQRQLMGSESPGKSFFEILKTWPHWSNEIPS